MMNFGDEFADRKILITGALGIIGKGLCRTFAEAGAQLCLTDRDRAGLDDLLADIHPPDGSFVHAADLTVEKDLSGLIDVVAERWTTPDVVINNAAVYPSGFMVDIDLAEWDRIMGLNLRAPFVLTRGFALQMIGAGRGGAVINISSGAARKVRRTVVPYCVSKTALDRLTKGFALELAEFGIRVNALEPGFAAGSTVSRLSQEHVSRVVSNIPLGRETSMRDVGQAALYLASDAAGFVTGTSLAVDGGHSAGSMDVFQEKKSPL